MVNTLYLIIADALLIFGLIIILNRLRRKKLKTYHSPFSGQIDIIEDSSKRRYLNINNYPQGFSADAAGVQDTYWGYIAQQILNHCKDTPNPHILYLGMGTNTSPHLVVKSRPDAFQTILEIDPAIIQANQDFFQLEQLHAEIIQADVFTYVQENTFPEKYDVIVNDVCSGTPPFISYQASAPEFVAKLSQWLKPQGLMLTNRWIDTTQNRQNADELVTYLQKHYTTYSAVDIIDHNNFKNKIIAAIK
jgi:spermidine synthase